MRSLPDGLDAGALVDALSAGWGIDGAALEYAPLGAGSYHWDVTAADAGRAFATVDDLAQKAWLGDTLDAAFAGLRAAFDTAAALAAGGLEFVVAPRPDADGASLRRIGARHTIAVFRFVDGKPGEFGDATDHADVVGLLAAVHAATPVAMSYATTAGVDVPGRSQIEAALRDTGTWCGGPYSEPARRAFAARRDDVVELVGLADRLAGSVIRRGAPFVVTHGEPHAANILHTAAGLVLVDWDTVALGPPERDMWMLARTPDDDVALRYADATGRPLDRDALDFFDLTWDLKDLAEYLNLLRGPHVDNEDTARALEGLEHCVSIRERWAARL